MSQKNSPPKSVPHSQSSNAKNAAKSSTPKASTVKTVATQAQRHKTPNSKSKSATSATHAARRRLQQKEAQKKQNSATFDAKKSQHLKTSRPETLPETPSKLAAQNIEPEAPSGVPVSTGANGKTTTDSPFADAEQTKPTPASHAPIAWPPASPTTPTPSANSNAPSAIPNIAATKGRRWPLLIGGSIGALLVIIGGSAFGFHKTWQGSGQIAPNIFIAGQPVGGLTRDEAIESLKSRFGNLDIKLTAPDAKWHLPIYKLGGVPDFNRAVNNAYWFGRSGNILKDMPRFFKARFDENHLNLGVRWNKAILKTQMRALSKKYERPACDARLEVNGEVASIVPDISGRGLNVGATLWDLQHRYSLMHTEIKAKVQETKPRLAAADLEGTDVRIGVFTTTFNSGLEGRTRNLHVASEAVNGKVLMPGDTFSFNAATGERTWEKGYRMAHIYETKPGKDKAEVVDGLAGGTCQVSTTLYNAVRKCNQKTDSALKIVQREMHSLPVPYISSGLDATVAWPNRDFKFKNTLSYPVYLRAAIKGERITMSIWARVPRGSAMQFAQSEDEEKRG